MGYALRFGLSFCEVGDRLIFLDLVADRYFCMSESAERSFRSLIAGNARPDGEWLAALVEDGLLIETPGKRFPQAYRREAPCPVSMVDEPARPASPGHRLAAIWALTTTKVSLRFGSLHRTLCKLAAAKAAQGDASRGALESAEVAAAFEWTRRVMRSHDQCLPRSIAVASRLAALGIPAELVIGVRLRPFAAHSWVEAGGRLVNDRFDTVRTYTPIAAV